MDIDLKALFANRKLRILLSVVLALVLFAMVCVGAYAQMFGQFAPWDDSGTMLLAFDGLVAGRGLYDVVILPYGPFFFQAFQPIFELVEPTTDNGRLIVLTLGLFLVVAMSLVVWTICRSTLLALASLLVSSMLIFSALASEPMHPVGLTMALSLGIVASILFGRIRLPLLMGLVGGLLIGGLLFTKINLGGYALLAVAFAVVAMGRFRGAELVRVLFGGLLVLLPFLVANRSLISASGGAESLDVLFLTSICMVPLVYAGFRYAATLGPEEYRWGREWLKGVPVGIFLTVAVSTIVFLMSEGSLQDLVSGLLEVPLRLGATFSSPLLLPFGAIEFSVLAAAACFAFFWFAKGNSTFESHWLQAALRITTGSGIWISLALVATGSPGAMAFPMAMAWLVLLPPAAGEHRSLDGLSRLLLPSLALIGVLGVYPVAGSQVPSAALLFVPVGALCLIDGISHLSLALGEPDRRRPAREGGAMLVKAAVFMLILPLFAGSAAANVYNYRQNEPTDLPNASRLRLAPDQAEELEGLVQAVKTARCTSLVTFPVTDSLVLWSGLSRTSPMALQNWLWLYTAEEQEALVAEASRATRPCLLRESAVIDADVSLCATGGYSKRVEDYLCGDSEVVVRTNGWELLINYPNNGARK